MTISLRERENDMAVNKKRVKRKKKRTSTFEETEKEEFVVVE